MHACVRVSCAPGDWHGSIGVTWMSHTQTHTHTHTDTPTPTPTLQPQPQPSTQSLQARLSNPRVSCTILTHAPRALCQSRCVALRCIALCCVVLHCVVLHCVAFDTCLTHWGAPCPPGSSQSAGARAAPLGRCALRVAAVAADQPERRPSVSVANAPRRTAARRRVGLHGVSAQQQGGALCRCDECAQMVLV